VFAISREMREQVVYLSSSRIGAWARENDTLVEDERGVFYEATVRVLRDSRELDDLIADEAQRCEVGRVFALSGFKVDGVTPQMRQLAAFKLRTDPARQRGQLRHEKRSVRLRTRTCRRLHR